MGMTAIEKILAKNSGMDVVKPGDLVVVKVGTAVLYDNNFAPSIWRDILKVHNPENLCKVGDLVKVMEIRPMSKHKNWLLKEVILESNESISG